MSARKTKSSSGDLKNVNPYMRSLRGVEVTSWKIDRRVSPYKITIFKKVL